MQILNYTGRKVGLEDMNGNPSMALPVDGFAKCETIEMRVSTSVGIIPIFRKSHGKVMYLPKPDPNHEIFYIVNKDVAEAIGDTRFDILVGEEPYDYKGARFFKYLVNI